MAVKEGKAYQYAEWCVLENEGGRSPDLSKSREKAG